MHWRTLTIVASVMLALSLTSWAGSEKVLWSKAIIAEPGRDSGGWFPSGIDQGEEHLVGIFGYANTDPDRRGPVSIQVHETKDGAYWPAATLEIKDRASGRWNKIHSARPAGKAKTVTVKPGEIRPELLINFDPVKAKLSRAEEAKITFDDGQTVVVPLNYLRPDK